MKTTSLILTKALVPVAAAALLAGSANAALISHYTFDDKLVNEVSGAPAGTMVGNETYVPGQFGKALDFDGNDAITTTTSGLPNSASGLPIGSVAFWINTTTAATFAVAGTVDNLTKTMWVLQGNRGCNDTSAAQGLRMFMRDDDNHTFEASADGGNWNNGAWHHIAITWDTQTFIGDAATVAQFYVNGLSVATTVYSPYRTGPAGPLDNLTAYDYPMAIGAFNVRGTISQHLTGQLDDYRVYDHVLSSNEVAALAVPEPSGAAMLGLAGLSMLMIRRRK